MARSIHRSSMKRRSIRWRIASKYAVVFTGCGAHRPPSSGFRLCRGRAAAAPLESAPGFAAAQTLECPLPEMPPADELAAASRVRPLVTTSSMSTTLGAVILRTVHQKRLRSAARRLGARPVPRLRTCAPDKCDAGRAKPCAPSPACTRASARSAATQMLPQLLGMLPGTGTKRASERKKPASCGDSCACW